MSIRGLFYCLSLFRGEENGGGVRAGREAGVGFLLKRKGAGGGLSEEEVMGGARGRLAGGLDTLLALLNR